MRKFIIFAVLILAGCNSVYVKPNSLDTNAIFFADRGGYGMRRSIKQRIEQRGHTIIVGRAISTKTFNSDEDDFEVDTSTIPSNVRYIIKVKERRESFRPIWCAFNGFWWWNFNVSIADQKTGEELMTWRGRGCAKSSLRKLDKILDELEIKSNTPSYEI